MLKSSQLEVSNFDYRSQVNDMELLQEFLAAYGYAGFLVILLVISIVPTPVPEDAITLGTGFLIATNQFELWPALPLLWLGVFCGDSYIYCLGYFLGSRLFEIKPFSFIYNDKRKAAVQEKLVKYGIGVIFLGRFIFGLRAQVYLNLGLLKFEPKRFFGFNLLAVLFHTSLMVLLGATFSDQIGAFIGLITKWGDVISQSIWFVLLGFIGLIVMIQLVRYFQERA